MNHTAGFPVSYSILKKRVNITRLSLSYYVLVIPAKTTKNRQNLARCSFYQKDLNTYMFCLFLFSSLLYSHNFFHLEPFLRAKRAAKSHQRAAFVKICIILFVLYFLIQSLFLINFPHLEPNQNGKKSYVLRKVRPLPPTNRHTKFQVSYCSRDILLQTDRRTHDHWPKPTFFKDLRLNVQKCEKLELDFISN
uniref:Uncharacterized protein n=1 Tax=Cacopsylla melanoneura TaxID=428564 RepID=A0A8D8ZZL7_9HEMI